MRLRNSLAWAVAALVAAAACHTVPTQVRLPALRSSEGKPDTTATKSLDALRRDIATVLAQPALEPGYWGVLVRSLKTNDTLYGLNAQRLMMPASNMKIVTLAAAAEKLGWDYTYETRVAAGGPIVNGTLLGDLLVIGSGDPSLMDGGGVGTSPFDAWIIQLRQHGVERIAGRIVGDDAAFPNQQLGFGWSWDDLADDYAAPFGALQFNENAVRVTVTPGAASDQRAAFRVAPATSGLEIHSLVITGAPDSAAHVEAHRLPGSTLLILSGSVPAGGPPTVRDVSVDNPALFFLSALRAALEAGGIAVGGPVADPDDFAADPSDSTGAAPIASFRSAPLSTLAIRLMKVSQNLYAETLLATLSAAPPATPSGGRATVRSVLASWGVPDVGLIQRDGSGLSRYDYVTPEALVTILTHVDRDARLRGPFEASLPIAGRDGTLSSRMKGTPAEGNVRAKTGSMSNVRALSGYVTTADGEPLVFSIIANNFDTAAAVVDKAADAVVVRLAEFRRSR
jgi:D-alanyl-D-alanine carboxypeptidase/D-alanyl-D-alanine-endopeptidase (penicillin-binding protein 4)